ncbi:perlucin-like protein [Mya arenaria]|uniref:perlucin-like protein n=1 Tax=Mya arenaria TaxID=6604 RepID=UPI0022E726E4|nr:perlucin-like protein [Mya arenaria]
MEFLLGKTAVLLCCLQITFGCRSGWMNHGTSCYHFSHDQESWIAAVTICERMGGRLVEVNDVNEFNFLQSYVNMFKHNYWVGGTDLENEGEWVWLESDKPMTGGYSNWEPGEPNSSGDEDCTDMRPGHHGWNDEKCWVNLNYVCEAQGEAVNVIG